MLLISLAVAAFAFNSIEMAPLGILPHMIRDLGLTAQEGGAMTAGYAAVIAFATLPLVRAARAINARWLLLTVLVTLPIGTTVFIMAGSLSAMYVSRFATAAAHGLLWSLMFPIAVMHFPQRMRGRVLAVLSVGSSLALVLGVPASALIAARTDWRVPLLALALLTTAAAAGVAWAFGKDRESTRDVHGPGTHPSIAGFAATLGTLGLSVTAVFLTMTYLSLLPVVQREGASGLAAALSTFGIAGLAGGYAAGRLTDVARTAVLAGALAALALGLLTLLLGPPHQATLTAAAGLMGLGAVGTPVVCQHLIFQNSPIGMPLALAASSTTFNIGVTVGGLAGGAMVDAGDSNLLVSASLAVALVTGIPAGAAVWRSRVLALENNACRNDRHTGEHGSDTVVR